MKEDYKRGIGIDIMDIKRFRRYPYQSNKSFYRRIFTSEEIRYCLSKAAPYQHFAARFSAKEAIFKSLGSHLFTPRDIEIVNDKNSHLKVKIKGKKTNILFSMSHLKDYAVAIALCLKKYKKRFQI